MLVRIRFVVLSSLLLASTALAAPIAPPVSPGRVDGPSTITSTTPTFSWGQVAGAAGYEVVVYEVAEDGAVADEPVLRTAVPGAATSWTPGQESALEPGREYAWTVRPLPTDATGGWAPARLFRIQNAPSQEELRWALEVLRRYEQSRPAVEPAPAAGVEGSVASATAPRPDLSPAPDLEEREAMAGVRENQTLIPAGSGPQPLSAGTSSQGWTGGEAAAGQPGPAAVAEPSPELDLLGTSVDSLGARARSSDGSTPDEGVCRGYLAIGEGANDFDGVGGLDIAGYEVGVLGASLDNSNSDDSILGFDNVGVLGYSNVFGGIFRNSSGLNQVTLAGPFYAIIADGNVDVLGTAFWHCPSGMQQVGAWCIDSTISGPSTGKGALTACHDQGKTLCPLEPLEICDQVYGSGVGLDCGSRTDDGAPFRAWASVVPDGTFGFSASAYDTMVEWDPDPNGMDRPNDQIQPVSNSTSLEYYCCRPLSGVAPP